MLTSEIEARPLVRFYMLANPEDPTATVLVMDTSGGPTAFVVRAEALRQMAKEFERIADGLPSGS
jgi:thymidine phosphorylase